MKGYLKIVLVVLLTIGLLFTTAACGSSNEATSNTTAGEEKTTASQASTSETSVSVAKEPITLKLFDMPSNAPSGEKQDALSKEIKSKLGITLDWVGNANQESLMVLMSSGELPDIVVFQDSKLLTQAIQGNLIMPIDELINTNGKDILANASQMVNFSKDMYSNGTGKLYGLASLVGPAAKSDRYMWGFYTRWDLYKQLGYPEIKTYTDIIPVLKKMQELESKNSLGQKTYAFSLWKDWDGTTVQPTLQLGQLYGILCQTGYHAEVDCTTYEMRSMFEPDSMMFKSAEFYNKCYQEGLLDPDSLTQKFDTATEKMKSGRTFASWWNWFADNYTNEQTKQGKTLQGMMPLYPEDSTAMITDNDSPFGGSYLWAISAKCKTPDRAMDLINYMYTVDGAMYLYNGAENDIWAVKDGKPAYTDETLADLKAGKVVTTASGTKYDRSYAYYYNSFGLKEGFINPKYGTEVNGGLWTTTRTYLFPDLWKDYDSHYSVDIPYKAYDKQRTNDAKSDIYAQFMEVMPDDIKAVTQKISDMAKTNVWKMIYAKNDAEAEKIKNDTIAQAKALGLDTELQWIKQAREKAKIEYDKYISK